MVPPIWQTGSTTLGSQGVFGDRKVTWEKEKDTKAGEAMRRFLGPLGLGDLFILVAWIVGESQIPRRFKRNQVWWEV